MDHSTCSHADNICFDVLTGEEYNRVKSQIESAAAGLADFDREFGISR